MTSVACFLLAVGLHVWSIWHWQVIGAVEGFCGLAHESGISKEKIDAQVDPWRVLRSQLFGVALSVTAFVFAFAAGKNW